MISVGPGRKTVRLFGAKDAAGPPGCEALPNSGLRMPNRGLRSNERKGMGSPKTAERLMTPTRRFASVGARLCSCKKRQMARLAAHAG